jgi:alkylated DNA nucleotide flippase Atl1
VSNSGWMSKRTHLDKHDVFLLNRGISGVEDWNEAVIDQRTATMTKALVEIWPVPPGHEGKIADRAPKAESWVEVKHLVAAGLIEPGTVLTARPGPWGEATATVLADGTIEVAGEFFGTPSGAGNKIRGGATNGWVFWRLPDGRQLGDIRAAYRGEKPKSKNRGFDWSPMHAILEALPDATWTSYAELATSVGTAPQPLGNHIVTCKQCTRPWRVLTWDGRIADAFTWNDPEDDRDPRHLLEADGVRVVEGKADPDQLLKSEDLLSLIADDAERPTLT